MSTLTNITNRVHDEKLAAKSGWEVVSLNGRPYDVAFHKQDEAAIYVKYAASGIRTVVHAVDFVHDLHRHPRADKAARLSHYLTEGIN